ncbi:MAG: phosphotransferase, partial [Chloroflexota bacterium]
RPLLATRPDDEAYVRGLAGSLRERVRKLPASALDWGICHGDLHLANAHVDEEGTMTVFDFDLCGYGWRAMDLAVQRTVMRLHKRDESLWDAYLNEAWS